MSKFILTRYLYVLDEVGISFISSLLKQQSLDECYFWISELYYSGFHDLSWDLIWFAFYDFYFINNPSFESFISNKQTIHDFKSLLSVVKNLFKMEFNSHVFVMRQYTMNINEITHVFKGKKPSWLQEYPTKYHGLFRFLDKKLYHFAFTSLPQVIEDDLFTSIQKYYNVPDRLLTRIRDMYYNNQYKNQIHKLCAGICLCIFNPTYDYENASKKIYLICSNEEHDTLKQFHEDPIPLTKYNLPQIYKTLEFKRKYAIHPSCASFNLTRYKFPDVNNIMLYHWEYYTYTCPLWNERFKQYNITVDDDKQRVIFHDDDDVESFYSQFGYDPDEQSRDTHNKGYLLCESSTWKQWYDERFKQPPIYEFKDDFKFVY